MNHLQYAAHLAAVVTPSVLELIVERQKVDDIEAMRLLFNSKLYAALEDEGTKVWHYSPEMLYCLLNEELETGNFTYPEEAL